MDFAGEMCSVTGREMAEARKLIRPSPRVPIVRNDVDRCTLLHEFIEITEKYDTGIWRGTLKDGVLRLRANHILTPCLYRVWSVQKNID